ncbi:hypothetical protein P9G84_22490 [Brevibacillus centrosporus]|uniref:hypothetical protein n=1 Tax=Brevibacillus centrosporus TaxID=54910 RepID=UPI000F09E0E7|nr:hypothetical protein [Brevibacillus centrosporus]MEC2131698.1 hypothetical protein [Brevibacillus centrosporus]RNB67346.1 hypothetical protein EDM55_20075 [Brevibacillus centrosporus]GED34006.1 hypothetical protein BCE02nite_51470 [Brevibacillus centrosporus]
MEEKEYLILTTRHKDMLFGGDVHLFWGTNGGGYTAILQRAGLYTKEKAYKLGGEGDIPVHYTVFGKDKSFFESEEKFIQMPTLYSIGKESKNLIADWQYQFRHNQTAL